MDGTGLKQHIDAAVLGVGQCLGHGHGGHALFEALAVQNVTRHIPALHGQHGVQRLSQCQRVAEQAGVVLPAIGLAQGDGIVLPDHDTLNFVGADQYHIRLGVIVAIRHGKAPLAEVIAHDVAAIVLAVGAGRGVLHAVREGVIRAWVVEVSHPQIAVGITQERGRDRHRDGLLQLHLVAALGGQVFEGNRADGVQVVLLLARDVEGVFTDSHAAHMAVKGGAACIEQDILRRQLPGGGVHGQNGRGFSVGGVIAGDVQDACFIALVHALGDEVFRKARNDQPRLRLAQEIRKIRFLFVGLRGHGGGLGVLHGRLFRLLCRLRGSHRRCRHGRSRGCRSTAAGRQEQGPCQQGSREG